MAHPKLPDSNTRIQLLTATTSSGSRTACDHMAKQNSNMRVRRLAHTLTVAFDTACLTSAHKAAPLGREQNTNSLQTSISVSVAASNYNVADWM